MGSGPGTSQGDCQNGVGPQLLLGLGSVQVDHPAVHTSLVQDRQPFDTRSDDTPDILDGPADSLPQKPARVRVPKFPDLVKTGGGSGGHGRPPQVAAPGHDIGFDGGVSPGVEDLSGPDIFDGGHEH